ncbi:hypothetical protein SDC9_187996 [bioreactor metagenome]|uniref:Uncharacterized protein n=1 Tax=bioreactor metagenome TaxID=1076179 RepID=A0A645HQE4_9ZZZZ
MRLTARKTPAILMHADQRINTVRAHANIQDCGLSWHTSRCLCKQIGQMVEVIGTPRNRRTQKPFRNIPICHPIEMRQQRLIQGLYRQRIGKINALFACGGQDEILRQLRRAFAERGKIVATVVTIARV